MGKLTEQLAEALRKIAMMDSEHGLFDAKEVAEEALAAYDAAKANGGWLPDNEDLRVLQNVRLKFTSGNSVPVERASVTDNEWQSVERLLAAHHLPPPPEQTP